MNCGATKQTEQRYKYAVDWLRYRLQAALHRLLLCQLCKTITPTYAPLHGAML
jgi:hypothetical protein